MRPPTELIVIAIANTLIGVVMLASIVPVWAVPTSHNSPYAFLSSICLTPFIPAVLIVQFRSVFRRKPVETRLMLALFFGGAGLCVFALVSNTIEIIADRQAPDWHALGIVAAFTLGSAAYGTVAGLVSLRWLRSLQHKP